MKTLAGKNVIITGASRGLGFHIATAMWENGANLLLIARSESGLEKVQKEFAANAHYRQEVHYVATDLKEPKAVEHIINKAREVWERLDGLINNAGILGPLGKVWETDWEEWNEALQINLVIPVALCRACIPWMKAGGGGKIVNLSGGGATRSRPYFTAYAVAKTGIVRFTEILAEEVRDLNIQVNCVAPGALNTDMLQAVIQAGPDKVGKEEYNSALRQKETGGASPERAAKLCVLLVSPASGITGKLISAVWDPWETFQEHLEDLLQSDVYTLRRVVPKDRGLNWG